MVFIFKKWNLLINKSKGRNEKFWDFHENFWWDGTCSRYLGTLMFFDDGDLSTLYRIVVKFFERGSWKYCMDLQVSYVQVSLSSKIYIIFRNIRWFKILRVTKRRAKYQRVGCVFFPFRVKLCTRNYEVARKVVESFGARFWQMWFRSRSVIEEKLHA